MTKNQQNQLISEFNNLRKTYNNQFIRDVICEIVSTKSDLSNNPLIDILNSAFGYCKSICNPHNHYAAIFVSISAYTFFDTIKELILLGEESINYKSNYGVKLVKITDDCTDSNPKCFKKVYLSYYHNDKEIVISLRVYDMTNPVTYDYVKTSITACHTYITNKLEHYKKEYEFINQSLLDISNIPHG